MILIKNGTIVDPVSKTEGKFDLVIEGEQILEVVETGAKATEELAGAYQQVIDASDCIVAPGLVDVHVHFRDPGFTYKEDIETGAKAALAGGITTVVLMANTKPVVDNVETLRYVIDKGAKTGLHVKTCAAISKDLKGQEMVDMALLKEQGAVGFTDDGIPLLEADFVKQAMEEAVKVDMPLSFHEENPFYIANNGVNHGMASDYYRIYGSDRMAEICMVDRDIELAKLTGAKVDIQHISTKEGVELVREARLTHKNIHAEATPHHFTLTEASVIEHGTLAKMNPPLRTEEDRMAIIEGLKDGTIEIIATDHAPHSKKEKNKDITEAPSGIIGLETALSLGVMSLVEPGHLTHMELLDRMVVGPCRLYGFTPNSIEAGQVADLVIYNPTETYTYTTPVSKSTNSPFIGCELTGKVKYTLTDGQVVYQDKE